MSKNLESFLKKHEQISFESSCFETPQFKTFAAGLKRALKADLKNSSLELADFSKGHFYVCGFLRYCDTYIYFNVGDVRLTCGMMHWKNIYFRTAKDVHDYRGGENHFCKLDRLIESAEALLNVA